MAQILKGTTYTSGGTVTDTNLNNLVDNATLQADAIDAQTDRPVLATSDTFLVTSGATLRKVTLANLLKVSPIIGGTTPAAVTATTLASTTLTTSGLATVGTLTSTGLATAGSLSVGGTSAHTGAATFASTAAFTGAATFDVAPNFNGGANLGNAAADPVVLNCTISGTLKGEPVVDLTDVGTPASGDKMLIKDVSDSNKLKSASLPAQYIKVAVRCDASGNIIGTALNVTSVTNPTTGNYTVTFPALGSANYIPIVSSGQSSYTANFSSTTQTTCNIQTSANATFNNLPWSLVILEV